MYAFDFDLHGTPLSPIRAEAPDHCSIELLYDDSGRCVDLRILEASPVLAAWLRPDPARGKGLRHALEVYARVAASGRAERFQLTRNDTGRTHRLFAYRLGDPAEPRIGILIDDVTAQQQTEASLRAAEARFRFLDTLGRATAGIVEADRILEVTTRLLGEHLGVNRCAYADLDPDADGFTVRGDWTAPGTASLVGRHRLSDFGPRATNSLHAGNPLVIADAEVDLGSQAAAVHRQIGIRAAATLPLVKEGRLTALMAVHVDQPRHWTAQELALLTEVTERCWAHIERNRAEQAARAGERRFLEDLEARVIERAAALQRSEKSLRTVLETSHLLQGLTSVDGRVDYANACSLRLIDARFDEVAGRPLWETAWFAATPGVADQIREAVDRVAAGASENLALVLDLASDQRSFDFSLRPVRNEAGKVVSVLFEGVDTTARIKAEQALVQAQKLEAIGRLTGGIAHDFNNLLMAVLGSLELLGKRCGQDPESRKLIVNATRAVDRGTSLTRRMLAFARRQDLRTEAVDIEALVQGMQELLQRSIGPMIQIDTVFLARLPAVETDLNQLESALLNLVINARDALRGHGRIVISGRETVVSEHGTLAPGGYVTLSVTDDGEGMSPETLRQALEPFFTTKGVGKGTGLGLPMVLGLAEQCGGTLTLDSEIGLGTTATIWLPQARQARPACRAEPAGLQATRFITRSPASSRPLTVLAVDDDDLILAGTVAMLEDLGHSVTTATSGAQALRHLAGQRFDLVLTDHAMPGMTGLQLADTVQLTHPGLPVVLMTGFADLPPDERPPGSADLPRLSKPFWQADLEEVIARAGRRRLVPAPSVFARRSG